MPFAFCLLTPPCSPLTTHPSVLDRFLQVSSQALKPYEPFSATSTHCSPNPPQPMRDTIQFLKGLLGRPLSFQNMDSQKRAMCPGRPGFSPTPLGSHRKDSVQSYLLLSSSLSPLSPSLPPHPPHSYPSQALNLPINKEPWLHLQPQKVKRSLLIRLTPRRFSTFWLRSSVRFSHLHI